MSYFKSTVRGFLAGALIVPAMGVLAHVTGCITDNVLGEDYSLKRRFEAAYCPNAPQSHREYTVQPTYGGYSMGEPYKEKYWAWPWLMWPATLVMGAVGAASELNEELQKRQTYGQYNNRGR